ncbi:MAG: DNA recombination/repair protein RecA, partial [Clostridia bacterium]|nr:DNA recombination/repair protein RecA [Clostridia bacterium]
KSNCSAIFINQLREKIGVIYGNPETTTGGRALKFYASVRIDVRKIETIKNGSEMIGSRTRARVVKNKVAPPFREAEFDVMYGKGISHTGELVDMGLEFDVLKRSGAWFYYGDTRIGQGKDNVKQLLEENEELAKELEKKITEKYEARMSGKHKAELETEEVIMPVEAEPAVAHRKVNIDIAVED